MTGILKNSTIEKRKQPITNGVPVEVETQAPARNTKRTYGPAPKANRQSIDNQIPQLREAIRLNLIRAGTLALNGRMDAAMRRAEYAMHQKERLQALVSKYMENQSQPAKPDATHNPRKAATKTIVKQKRYRQWSKD